jgi:RNA polymerase sigma-70 factor (ECF subfamily)
MPAAQIERWMAASRPQLLRLARSRGLSAEAADDVVQETLLEAWRHLDALTVPDGFSAWLAAICRNVCRRHARAQRLLAGREVPMDQAPAGDGDDASHLSRPIDLPDPLALDPAEEMEREDWETLVDRALGYLPAPAREAVALCYLAELPQRETALQLGLTIRALEARLHRARRQLRRVLQGPLRTEALALGVALDGDLHAGWQQTRLWCPACGRSRLDGVFESLPGERVNLRLRCPDCGHRVDSWGHVPLDGLRSFRPAYKRVMRATSDYFLRGLASGWLACAACGTPQPVRVVGPGVPDAPVRPEEGSAQSGWQVVTACRACGRHHADSGVAALLWTHPAVQRFLAAHPRSVTEPGALVEHLGSPAIRACQADVRGAARLTLFADPQTLRVRAAYEE